MRPGAPAKANAVPLRQPSEPHTPVSADPVSPDPNSSQNATQASPFDEPLREVPASAGRKPRAQRVGDRLLSIGGRPSGRDALADE